MVLVSVSISTMTCLWSHNPCTANPLNPNREVLFHLFFLPFSQPSKAVTQFDGFLFHFVSTSQLIDMIITLGFWMITDK